MQLLYGNDGINYRTIDKSPDMSDGVEKAILGTYSKYEFVSDPRAYMDEPEAVTYVTSNLDRQLPDNRLVVCKAGRMRSASSPSYYLHCLVREVSEDFYEDQFFEVFNYRFVSDYDISQYGGGTIDGYRFTTEITDSSALTEEQAIVILSCFMSNENKAQKTKILVDAVGDEYNDRSRAILASIYRYLPPAMRKIYGFRTYCQDGRNLPARVSFALFNREEAKDDSGCITLQETLEGIRSSVEEKYIEYASYLVGMDEEERASHFEAVAKLEKAGWLAIDDCVLFYTKLKEWKDGTQEELLPDWILYIDQNSFLKGPLYERLTEIIAPKIDNDYYNTYLFDKVLELYHESIYSLSPLAARTFRFADCVDGIHIDGDRFHAWYRSQLEPKLAQAGQDGQLSYSAAMQICREEIESLKEIDIMSREVADLLQKEIGFLSEKLQKCEESLADEQGQELEVISREIQKLQSASLNEFCDAIAVIWESIRFQENREDAVPTIDEWADAHIQKEFVNLKKLDEYEQQFAGLRGKLSVKKYQEYEAVFEAERQRLREEEQARFFIIGDDEILDCYKSLVIYLDKGVLEPEDEVEVRIGDNSRKRMKAKALERVLEFLLHPCKATGIRMRSTSAVLKNTNLFTVEHLPYLLTEDLEAQHIEELIEYYLDVKASTAGSYVGKLIKKKCDDDMIKQLRKTYKDSEGEFYSLYEALTPRRKENPPARTEDWEDEPKAKSEKSGFKGLFGRKR